MVKSLLPTIAHPDQNSDVGLLHEGCELAPEQQALFQQLLEESEGMHLPLATSVVYDATDQIQQQNSESSKCQSEVDQNHCTVAVTVPQHQAVTEKQTICPSKFNSKYQDTTFNHPKSCDSSIDSEWALQTCKSGGRSIAINKIDEDVWNNCYEFAPNFCETNSLEYFNEFSVKKFKFFDSPLKTTDSVKPFNEKESKIETPVAKFPSRETFQGPFNFCVSFPEDSPKLIVSLENGHRRLNTVRDEPLTIFIHHNAQPSALVRFFLIFSNESETTTPVRACKNHSQSEHPDHMLNVEGCEIKDWSCHPHLSVLVSPTAVPCHPYCATLRFLCRNSCLTRKSLTLIVQLEINSVVVGREALDLKVSACPRRDSKRFTSAKAPLGREIVLAESDSSCFQLLKNKHHLSGEMLAAYNAAYLVRMEERFRTLYPSDYAKESGAFDEWWMQKIN